jgi:hypothetical protein
MMKNVNKMIAGTTINRYVGETGKKMLFTKLSGFRLARTAAPWERSAVAVMPAS